MECTEGSNEQKAHLVFACTLYHIIAVWKYYCAFGQYELRALSSVDRLTISDLELYIQRIPWRELSCNVYLEGQQVEQDVEWGRGWRGRRLPLCHDEGEISHLLITGIDKPHPTTMHQLVVLHLTCRGWQHTLNNGIIYPQVLAPKYWGQSWVYAISSLAVLPHLLIISNIWLVFFL